MVKAVQSFIQNKTAEVQGTQEHVPDQEPIEQKPIEVPPSDDFAISPQEAAMSDALANDPSVTVTDYDKEVFLKAVLNDEPVRLKVVLYGGKFTLDLRSRTTHEQRRIFDVLEMDRKDGIIPPDNIALMVTRMQQYFAVLMIERVNGLLFSDLTIEPGQKLEDDAFRLRDTVTRLMEKMVGVRWNSMLSALRYFESKCARLNTEALNEGFWKPQGSV